MNKSNGYEPTFTWAQLQSAVAVERKKSRANALEEAAKVCDVFEQKKWEILAKGGVAAGLSPADCAAAIRSMK